MVATAPFQLPKPSGMKNHARAWPMSASMLCSMSPVIAMFQLNEERNQMRPLAMKMTVPALTMKALERSHM